MTDAASLQDDVWRCIDGARGEGMDYGEVAVELRAVLHEVETIAEARGEARE
jgi:hypothetical protein